MLFNKNKSEKYHMNYIDFIMKDCWHSNLTDIESIVYVKKYLKHKRLNKTEHSFLIKFREDLNNINLYTNSSSEELDIVLKDFYIHLRKVNSHLRLVK